jgi:SAM-dependent methyltransferase
LSKRKPIEELLTERGGIRLDIGCGASKQGDGWVGMDIRDLPTVDIVHDFEVFPWPIPDECVLVAVASHVIEHIAPQKFGFIRWMDELWRVMKPDGEVAIAAPHGHSPGFLQDPTHCNPCNEATFAYFDPLEPNTGGALYQIYRPKPWKIKYLSWSPAANIEVVLIKRRWDESYGT